jgi:TonB-linked SusC/RagA family outer membrane protein
MRKFLLTCLALAIALSSFAQERTVSGKVTAVEDGSPLPGVNVVVKGTTSGTVSDADGKYSINVPNSGGTLVFSFIGLQSQEVAIGERSVVDIQMTLDVQQLSEVVVTAIGIEREKKALGYSVATVSADNVAQRSEPDPLRAMQGKMPGVNIIGGGGAPGQSTKINIRGMSSFTGNTQPLFVVDGIPFDNSVNASTGSGSSQNTVYSNRAFDIDPNNIESISILKGAAASALYGSRATNGVVVITTKASKKGVKKGVEVNYKGSLNFEELSGIPDYQDVYTQGSNQVYNGAFIGNWGAPFPDHVDEINAKYGTSYTKVYGVYPDGQPYPEGYAPNPINNRYPGVFPEYVQQYTRTDNGLVVPVSAPYKVEPHDIIGGFFQTGKVVENSVNLSSGTERASINAGFSRMDQEGILPNTEANRTSLNFGGNGELENGLSLSGTVNYVNTKQQSPQSGGSAFTDYYTGDGGGGASMYARLFYLPRNFDLNGLPFENPVNGNNIFYRALDNPRWIAKYNLYNSNVNRVFGNITAGYDINEWLNVLFKGGINTYHEARRNVIRKGGIQVPNGQIWTEDLTNTEQDYNLMISLDKDLSESVNLRALAGFNANQREFNSRRVTGSNVISSGLNLTDATSTQVVDYDYSRLRRLNGLYVDLSASYKDYLFLNVVGRNDWTSTLAKGNNSYFYPGASVSFIASEVFTMPAAINFLKLRAGMTKVGNDADPYLTGIVYSISTPFTTSAGTVVNRGTLGNTLGNKNLKPEFTTETEGGIEAKFLDGKIGLDLTYFSRVSTNQIASASIARSSGFSRQIVNVGELTNKGWEIGLDLTPVKLDNGFTWNIYSAFTKIKSEIVDAGPNGEIFIGGPATTFGVIHKNGYPYGQIYGTRNARDSEGNLLIDPNTGLPFALPTADVIGDPNPDFTLGITNTFTFKGFTLRALLDWRQGGDLYSFTAASLLLRGQLANSVDREALRVVPGVLGDPQTFEPILEGSSTIKNTIPITAFDSHFSNGWGAYGQDEVNIYDGTVIRLREISLAYSLPKSILEKTPFGSAAVSVSGRNLWFNAPNMLEGLNLDPEVLGETAASNIQGFEYGAAPTTKRYGVNLTLTF